MDKDVTALVDFNNNDDECLPITKCVCGEKFASWKFIISIYREDAYACPSCGRRLYFALGIKVYEVESEQLNRIEPTTPEVDDSGKTHRDVRDQEATG